MQAKSIASIEKNECLAAVTEGMNMSVIEYRFMKYFSDWLIAQLVVWGAMVWLSFQLLTSVLQNTSFADQLFVDIEPHVLINIWCWVKAT